MPRHSLWSVLLRFIEVDEGPFVPLSRLVLPQGAAENGPEQAERVIRLMLHREPWKIAQGKSAAADAALAKHPFEDCEPRRGDAITGESFPINPRFHDSSVPFPPTHPSCSIFGSVPSRH